MSRYTSWFFCWTLTSHRATFDNVEENGILHRIHQVALSNLLVSNGVWGQKFAYLSFEQGIQDNLFSYYWLNVKPLSVTQFHWRRFDEGVNTAEDLVLVPKQSKSGRLNYRILRHLWCEYVEIHRGECVKSKKSVVGKPKCFFDVPVGQLCPYSSSFLCTNNCCQKRLLIFQPPCCSPQKMGLQGFTSLNYTNNSIFWSVSYANLTSNYSVTIIFCSHSQI